MGGRRVHTGAAMMVEFRVYTDWRWRHIRDRAGSAVWLGPVAIYFWRDPADRLLSR